MGRKEARRLVLTNEQCQNSRSYRPLPDPYNKRKPVKRENTMDSKGIEFQGVNLVPSIQLKDLKKDTRAIRPVQKGNKTTLYSDAERGRTSCRQVLSWSASSPSEEDARYASEIMAEYLRDMPELESDWAYDKASRSILVEVKNKKTGKVIRQIPPEEILAGNFVPDLDAGGNIINRVA